MNVRATAAMLSYDWDAYGRDVIAGKIPVCKQTRLAIERHYRDLETGAARGLWFSQEHAQHALETFLFYRHSKGEWAGQQFELAPWQQFWIALAFGWMRADGTRRFREVWEEVPRKNGKSTKIAGIGIYLFQFDGEGGAEVYTAATKMDQARITHSEAVRMVENSPLLRRHIGIRRDELHNPAPGRADKFEPLGRDAKSLDGLNPHGALLDEVHAHPDRQLYDIIKSGVGARRQPLIWMITTAGFDLSSFGYEQHLYAEQVLNGVFDDDEFLAIIYTVDDAAKWQDPAEWAKANPNLGISVHYDNLKAACEQAIRKPTEQSNFKTKRLNIWLTGGESWIPVQDWQGCAAPELRLQDFAGEECFIGIDLAEKNDIAAVCLIFRRGNKVHAFFRYYYHEDGVKDPKNQHLKRWADAGHLIVNEGNATDFDLIRTDLNADLTRHQIKEVPYDPKFAAYFAAKLAEDGLPMVEISQTSKHFTMPIIEIENLVLTKNLTHDGNPVTTWMMSNVLMLTSKFSGLKHPTKDKPEQKIDGPVALLLAAGRALMFAPDADINEYLNAPISA